jgi:RimJ/RimL family protein N-acetyltransferase
VLEGNIINLRPLETKDLEREFTWVNDSEVTQFLYIRYPMSRTDEERFLRDRPANDYGNIVLAIETKAGNHIGNIGLHQGKPEDRNASLGIMIGDKDYWSNGYGSDALLTLLGFGFHEMNLHRVWLHVYEFNERAISCYRKCGFLEEGRLRQHAYQKGRYWDTVVMGILRGEFDQLGPA